MAWIDPEEIVTEVKGTPGWEEEKRLDWLRSELVNGTFTIEEVIDSIVELNGIVGVGLISLGDMLKEYCYAKVK